MEESHTGVLEALVSRSGCRVDELEQLDPDTVAGGQDAEFDLSHLLRVRTKGELELVGVRLSSEVSNRTDDFETQNLSPPFYQPLDVDARQGDVVERPGGGILARQKRSQQRILFSAI